MAKRYIPSYLIFIGLLLCSGPSTSAQKDETRFHVVVGLVQLNVAVTDNKNNYVTGLKPSAFTIAEDGMAEKLATFGEGDAPTRRLLETADLQGQPAPAENAPSAPQAEPAAAAPSPVAPSTDQAEAFGSAFGGANVFILFDTSN